MSDSGCVELTARATTELETESGRTRVLDLLAANAPAEEFLREFVSRLEPAQAELTRREFAELPSSMVDTVIHTWAMAAAAGKTFQLRSIRPDRPVEFARAKRVRFQIDAEADRVVVSLSHVPGRHAEWYAPVGTA